MGINQIISNLLTLSKRFQLNCQQTTAVVSIVTLYFEHAERSHISHFTYHLRYHIIIDHVLASYIKSCYVYVKFVWFKRTKQKCLKKKDFKNQPIN